MPTSTRYTGNEFISRRQRQDSVVLYNRKADEVNKQAVYVSKTLSNVRVEMTNNVAFTTGGKEKQSNCKLSIELRDGNAGYVGMASWTGTDPTKWTIQPGKDYFIYKSNKFMINSLIEKENIKGGVDILEIMAG